MGNGLRFEAAAFNIEARQVVQEMKAAGHALVAVSGESGLANFVSKPTRFPRVYVDAAYGTPFLSSSDIISLRPELENFLSKKLTSGLEQLLVRESDVLISRSGTVGNVGLAPERFSGWALSEHALRLRAPQREDSGFIAAFLRSRYGRVQLTSASYGSVVQIHGGWDDVPDELLLKKDLPAIETLLRKAYGDKRGATQDFNQLHDLLNSPSQHVWVTFEDGFMWWCTTRDDITITLDPESTTSGHFWLTCSRPWSKRLRLFAN